MGKFISLPVALQPYASQSIWVIWKMGSSKTNPGKLTKVPYQAAKPRYKARCNDPSTWAPFSTALAAFQAGQGDGIGFALRDIDLGALDLDDCRNANGDLESEARDLIDQANSYTEITPSDSGLRIIMKATGQKLHRVRPVPNANGMKIEFYRRCERFITVTGNVLPGAPDQLADGDILLDQTFARLDAAAKQAKTASQADQAGQGIQERQKGRRPEGHQARSG
jgi:primase-polymerase (primpol)-like protein